VNYLGFECTIEHDRIREDETHLNIENRTVKILIIISIHQIKLSNEFKKNIYIYILFSLNIFILKKRYISINFIDLILAVETLRISASR